MRRKMALFGNYRLCIEIGNYLAATGYDFFIVDNDEQNLSYIREKGFNAVKLDYTDDRELERIGVGRDIDIIFCLFSKDSENVFLTISARALSPTLEIVSTIEATDSTQKLIAAGANKIIDPYQLVGRRISRLIRKPIISDILDKILFGQEDLELAEVAVPAGSFPDNKLLLDLHLSEDYNLIIIGIVDQVSEQTFLFATESFQRKLTAGDILLVIGPDNEINRFKRAIAVSAQSAAG